MLSGEIDKGVWNGFYLALMIQQEQKCYHFLGWVRTKKDRGTHPPSKRNNNINQSDPSAS